MKEKEAEKLQQKQIAQPPTREFDPDADGYMESEADRGLLQSECEVARWYE